jgi:hypothetical protein
VPARWPRLCAGRGSGSVACSTRPHGRCDGGVGQPTLRLLGPADLGTSAGQRDEGPARRAEPSGSRRAVTPGLLLPPRAVSRRPSRTERRHSGSRSASRRSR